MICRLCPNPHNRTKLVTMRIFCPYSTRELIATKILSDVILKIQEHNKPDAVKFLILYGENNSEAILYIVGFRY